MPLPPDVFNRLVNGDLGESSSRISDYTEKLPLLDVEQFPDDLLVRDLAMSGSNKGRELHTLLHQSGLTKSQRAGVSHLLGSFEVMGDEYLLLRDIRALNEDELNKLRPEFKYGNPSLSSIHKIKRLLG